MKRVLAGPDAIADAVRAGKCSVGTDPRGSGLAVTAGN